MWISRKTYNFLKKNAEKNIDAECAILAAKDEQTKAVARAMEEYSAVLKELDELKARLAEYEKRWVPQLSSFEDIETPLYPTLNHIPNCCKACSNHPSNGGSGICNCTAPYFEQDHTIICNT